MTVQTEIKSIPIIPVEGCHYWTIDTDGGPDIEWRCVGYNHDQGTFLMRSTLADGSTALEICMNVTCDLTTMRADWEIIRRVVVAQ